MKRTPLRRTKPLRSRRPEPPPVERRGARVVGLGSPRAVVSAVMAVALAEAPARQAPKEKVHRDQRIRNSARDEQCLIRLPGCIGHTPGATIWSHYRGSAGGKGMSLKSGDSAGCYACTYCDAVYDGQRPPPAGYTLWMVQLAWHEAHIRSLGRLHQKGLL